MIPWMEFVSLRSGSTDISCLLSARDYPHVNIILTRTGRGMSACRPESFWPSATVVRLASVFSTHNSPLPMHFAERTLPIAEGCFDAEDPLYVIGKGDQEAERTRTLARIQFQDHCWLEWNSNSPTLQCSAALMPKHNMANSMPQAILVYDDSIIGQP